MMVIIMVMVIMVMTMKLVLTMMMKMEDDETKITKFFNTSFCSLNISSNRSNLLYVFLTTYVA
jgi:hypothetical protein